MGGTYNTLSRGKRVIRCRQASPPVASISNVAKKIVNFFCFSRIGQKNFMF